MTLIKTIAPLVLTFLSGVSFAGPVNVNTADAQTLANELHGVGLSKARAIVAYRDANGPFTDIAQLANVKGIGARLLERNLDDVLLSDPK